MCTAIDRAVRLALLLALLSAVDLPSAFAQGTAFTYQGRLNEGGNPANGSYIFRFSVYPAPGNSPPLGTPITTPPVEVSNGMFSVMLDFGDGIFTGDSRWLGLEVHTNDNAALFVALTPLQPILPTPYAIYAGGVDATGISGTVPGASISGFFPNAMSLTNVNNTFAGDGTGLTNVNAATLGGLSASNFWKLGGNASTTAGTHFLGTTDNQPLEIKVNGLRALRIEDNGDSADLGTEPDGAPNLIGGSPANVVGAGVVGATIAGGGSTNYDGFYGNRVLSDFGVVGGGSGNVISTNLVFETIAGGFANYIGPRQAPSPYGGINGYSSMNVIGGGSGNTIEAFPIPFTVGYGGNTIAGGLGNSIGSNLFGASIAGGEGNHVRSDFTVINGGKLNFISTDSSSAAIAGGSFNSVATNSSYSAIGGGYDNTIAANSPGSTIAGGQANNITNTSFAAISGGNSNSIEFVDYGPVIGVARSDGAFIGGGMGNRIPGGLYGAIVGGRNNRVGDSTIAAVVLGGENNAATASYSVTSGNGAVSQREHSETHGAMFAQPGDAQCARYTLVTTTPGIATQLLAGPRPPVGSAIAFTALISAKAFGDASAGFEVKGLIRNYGTVVSLVGSPTVTILGRDGPLASADVTVEVYNSDTLAFRVSSGSALNVRWIGCLQTSEVSF